MVISILSLFMIVCGFYFIKGGTKKLRWWIGYRTKMSMKNKETWVFAHKYCGKFLVPVYSILLILSIVATIFLEHGAASVKILGTLGAAFLVAIVIAIILTEIALKNEFDKNGERR